MGNKRVEYAAHYPMTLDGEEFEMYGPVGRKEAVALVRYVNKRAVNAGLPERALLMERTVEVGDWTPSEMEAVASERVRSDERGKQSRQGEDDLPGGGSDGEARPDH